MNNEEKMNNFLDELNELIKHHGVIITSEGSPLLLYDIKEKKYIGEFGTGAFSHEYMVYEVD